MARESAAAVSTASPRRRQWTTLGLLAATLTALRNVSSFSPPPKVRALHPPTTVPYNVCLFLCNGGCLFRSVHMLSRSARPYVFLRCAVSCVTMMSCAMATWGVIRGCCFRDTPFTLIGPADEEPTARAVNLAHAHHFGLVRRPIFPRQSKPNLSPRVVERLIRFL